MFVVFQVGFQHSGAKGFCQQTWVLWHDPCTGPQVTFDWHFKTCVLFLYWCSRWSCISGVLWDGFLFIMFLCAKWYLYMQQFPRKLNASQQLKGKMYLVKNSTIVKQYTSIVVFWASIYLNQSDLRKLFNGWSAVVYRQFLWSFRLPGEAQKIDRMMECFAERYCELNPGVFTSSGMTFN